MAAHKASGSTMTMDGMPGFIVDALGIAYQHNQQAEAAMDEAVNNA